MKKILALVAAVLLSQTLLFAQSGKSVSTKDVPERYVKDFNRLTSNATDADWYMVDTLVFDAYYTSANGNKSSLRFSPKGTETRWYINEKYYPHTVVNQIHESHPDFKIKELYRDRIEKFLADNGEDNATKKEFTVQNSRILESLEEGSIVVGVDNEVKKQ